MRIFLKIITFPLCLVFLVAAFILRGVFFLIGELLIFFSEVADGILALIGKILCVLSITATIAFTYSAKNGTMETSDAVWIIVIMWLLTFITFNISRIGASLGIFIEDLGPTLTDLAIDLITL